ncbi:MAG: Rieske (2Fe-2S) protein [Deltaproteobacteria bacterium]|nr:Rieske (2Fe-2S) protein [Deltaproteobacteria bacterium]
MLRRRFLGAALAAAGAALAAAWASLAGARRGQQARRVTVDRPPADGVTFARDLVLVKRGAELRAFSSRCPHLGCRIARLEGAELVCPCHGSRFDLAGRRLHGPAASDLRPLSILERADDDGRIDVVLSG